MKYDKCYYYCSIFLVMSIARSEDSDLLSRCYGKYGCFTLRFPWTSRLNTKSPYELYEDDEFAIENSDFDNKRLTFIATHGYMEHGGKRWILKLKDELLIKGDFNVIILNWLSGSRPPYTQATANIRLIGTMAAHFLKFLHDFRGLDLLRTHVIGHSLGAHLCGYIGSKIKEFGLELGRITGLDPAEPHFEKTNPVVRLDPSDAFYVDIIHTDAKPLLNLGVGIWDPSGHLDFYPNGGKTMAGCDPDLISSVVQENGNLPFAFRRLVSCNHIRAYEYFIESINDECQFLGVQCSTHEKFLHGDCFDSCESTDSPCYEYMGYNAFSTFNGSRPNRGPLKYFLLTGEQSPFCVHHYRISIVLSDTPESRKQGGDRGIFFLILRGEKNNSTILRVNSEEEYFEHGKGGKIYKYVVPSREYMGPILYADVFWVYSYHLLNPLTWRIKGDSVMFINRIEIEELGTPVKHTFCGDDLPLISGKPRKIMLNSDCKLLNPGPGISLISNVLNADPIGNVQDIVEYVNPLNTNPLNGLAYIGNTLRQLISTINLLRHFQEYSVKM